MYTSVWFQQLCGKYLPNESLWLFSCGTIPLTQTKKQQKSVPIVYAIGLPLHMIQDIIPNNGKILGKIYPALTQKACKYGLLETFQWLVRHNHALWIQECPKDALTKMNHCNGDDNYLAKIFAKRGDYSFYAYSMSVVYNPDTHHKIFFLNTLDYGNLTTIQSLLQNKDIWFKSEDNDPIEMYHMIITSFSLFKGHIHILDWMWNQGYIVVQTETKEQIRDVCRLWEHASFGTHEISIEWLKTHNIPTPTELDTIQRDLFPDMPRPSDCFIQLQKQSIEERQSQYPIFYTYLRNRPLKYYTYIDEVLSREHGKRLYMFDFVHDPVTCKNDFSSHWDDRWSCDAEVDQI
jgi:hypothetical protein